MSTEAIKRATDIVGGTVALARALEVPPTVVSEWLTGKRRVPLARCPQVERLTAEHGNTIPREQLRPDINWDVFDRPAA